jgi:glucose-1-phosphate cytidylyltransferase
MVNGGIIACKSQAQEGTDREDTMWEQDPKDRLVAHGQRAPYRTRGFWQPLDSLRDKTVLESLRNSGKAPWKVSE